MSLATRCTSCGTSSRRAGPAQGLRRLGALRPLREVFNALEGLFDLDRDAPPEWNERADAGPRPPRLRRRPNRPMSTSMLARRPARRRLGLAGGNADAADPGRSDRRRQESLELVPVDGAGAVRGPARRPDRCASLQEARPRGRRQGRRSRPARVLRRPLRLRPVPRERLRPTRPIRPSRRPAAAATCRSRARTSSPTSCAAPSARRAGAAARARWRSARAARSPRWRCCCRSAITSATPSPPAGRRCRPVARRLVQARRLHPRGAAPDRRRGRRQHRAHPRDRPRRLRPVGHAAATAARCRSPCRRST